MLKQIIAKQKQDRDEYLKLPYVPRGKAVNAKKYLESDLIKVVLGPRRAGKSVFTLQLLKDKNFAYFNFDHELLQGLGGILNLYDLMDELKALYGHTKFVMFDEIQNLNGWELFVNRLHREGYNLFLTGSNASLLSKDLATHLTGRHIPIEILPFSFREIWKIKGVDHLNGLELLNEYLVNGGYPEVVLKNAEPKGYLDILYDAVLLKDVIKRYKVRAIEPISVLGSYLLDNISSHYTISRLKETLKLNSLITTEKHLKYLVESYLLFSLSKYSFSSSQRLLSVKKNYVVDNGFVAAKAVKHSPDTGKLMENLVFIELLKQGKIPNQDLFYYKTKNDREVDFLIKNGHLVTELIQVCYDISNPDTLKRETTALFEAAKELNVTNLKIIIWKLNQSEKKKKDIGKIENEEIEKDGVKIQVVGLLDFLLQA